MRFPFPSRHFASVAVRSFPSFTALTAFVTLSFPARAVDFAHEVVPILREHCAECHTGDKKKGGLSMNTREDLLAGSENGAVVKPGSAGDSLFLKLLHSTDPDNQMPPKGDRLAEAKINTLRAWVEAGVPWESGFAFKKPPYEPPLKPRKPALPAAVEGRTNPIDCLLDAFLTQAKLPRPAPLEDAAFLRRVSMDLVGLLPTPEEISQFTANPSPDKRAKAVDGLLANTIGYADHWLTFWNDLLRNDYAGTGYIDGGRTQITDWLYKSLLENKAYDVFARELIAPKPANAGFANGIKWRGNVSAGQVVPVQYAQSVGQTFLGINLKCASCHDSFVDRWKLTDAYGLAAIYSGEPLELHRCDKPTGQKAQASWLFPELGNVDATKPPAERMKQLAALMTHPENGRFPRTIVNRLWHRLMGHGIVHPVDAMQTAPWNLDLLDYLASHLAENKFNLKATLALICNSAAYQSRSENWAGESTKPYVYAGPRAKRMTAEQFVDSISQITNTAAPKADAPVLRTNPAAPKKPAQPLQATWIWSHETPVPASGEKRTFRKTFTLTERPVGAGGALTCDNGFELWVNGRKISTGDNWETPQGAEFASALKVGENQLVIVGINGGSGPNAAGLFAEFSVEFKKAPPLRIATDASWSWTSTALGKKGQVPPQANWQPAVVLNGPQAWAKVLPEISSLLQMAGSPAPMVRASLLKSDLLMRTLGRPNREQIVSMRPDNLTTLEAMDLNNGKILDDRLATGAANLLKRDWANAAALVDWIYLHALARAPSSAERSLALETLGTTPQPAGLQDFLWAVLMLPEYQLIR